ncbi:hypothetical protein FLM48_06640 [Shewanella sp. Scap07]|uniref:hypothetical protein n=1 Tax=Shewanella sp. Scap07 TaxID=2589987 RepID=UPI0015BD8A35|nr:hypothetical protein [Shewanella sp. Scap07]QLE84789.1 hypothetical protein FLM48_06640 [Shewanella sp. Scap07]
MKLLAVLLLMVIINGCEPVSSYEPETRPITVPKTALWVGGPDGGVYVAMNNTDKGYVGTVYFDGDGEVWYQGSFKYTGTAPFDVNSLSVYAAWDGDTLYLTDGSQLVSTPTPVEVN